MVNPRSLQKEEPNEKPKPSLNLTDTGKLSDLKIEQTENDIESIKNNIHQLEAINNSTASMIAFAHNLTNHTSQHV